jgi:FPC/CPF motif-containing protein YcgG
MTGMHFARSDIIRSFPEDDWRLPVFREFASTLESEARPFPCLYGITGYRTNQLRFAFLENIEAARLAPILEDYIKNARSFGPQTTLVVLSRPGGVEPLETYRRRFWTLLSRLSEVDKSKWPEGIPQELDHPAWEFCFAGEPIFVACNTPAHVLRQSRRSSALMLLFQPRWVFDRILTTPEKAQAVFETVRRRLLGYDLLPPAPSLGRYGDPAVREYQQYFLSERSDKPKCPFTRLNKNSDHASTEKEKA